MGKNNFENWCSFWIPILKKQYFKYRILEDYRSIVELKDNIWKNWYFDIQQKKYVWYLISGEGK